MCPNSVNEQLDEREKEIGLRAETFNVRFYLVVDPVSW